jgi:hypothetical protein
MESVSRTAAALVISLMVSLGSAAAGTRTYVSLAGRDDSIVKLGRPGVAVHVVAPRSEDALAVEGELARELSHQVHTRLLAPGEPGDYELEINVEHAQERGTARSIVFEAALVSAAGERLWRIDGRADVDDGTLSASVYAGIGRNVVSALVHDGWLTQRYDPDDPPPPPPALRAGSDRR